MVSLPVLHRNWKKWDLSKLILVKLKHERMIPKFKSSYKHASKASSSVIEMMMMMMIAK